MEWSHVAGKRPIYRPGACGLPGSLTLTARRPQPSWFHALATCRLQHGVAARQAGSRSHLAGGPALPPVHLCAGLTKAVRSAHHACGGGVGGDGCSVVLWWCICRAVSRRDPPLPSYPTPGAWPWGYWGPRVQDPQQHNGSPPAPPPLRAVQNIPPCPVTTQVLDTHSRSGSTVPQPPSTSADGHTYTDHGSLPSSSAAPLPRATFEQTVSCHAPLSPLLADPRQTTLSLSRCPSSQRRTSPRRPSSPSFSQSVSQSSQAASHVDRRCRPQKSLSSVTVTQPPNLPPSLNPQPPSSVSSPARRAASRCQPWRWSRMSMASISTGPNAPRPLRPAAARGTRRPKSRP